MGNFEGVPGGNFVQQDDGEYLENVVDDPVEVKVPVTPEIWDRMWCPGLKTKKNLKIGWLDVSVENFVNFEVFYKNNFILIAVIRSGIKSATNKVKTMFNAS